MRKINLLDCTLRDGGYINDWNFGHDVICDIIDKLVVSGVEYVECGYLSEKNGGDPDKTLFATIDDLLRILPEREQRPRFALMINYGEYNVDALPPADDSSPVIRVCFHQKDCDGAISYCGQLVEKGYTVFVQPMASLNYTDSEFIDLIYKVNEIHPQGFYIVDSFGVIELKEFKRLLSLSEHNLDMSILLGYHSHNNLQQAYGNAKYFVEQPLNHDILLDASVYGMGRGAGNLNMELFASFLNKNYDKVYNIDAFLEIMDDYLKSIFTEHFWGYSLPFYLSAQYNCHPNYAGYFSEKNTLTNKSMRQLLSSLPEDVKAHYSEEQAERAYLAFQRNLVDDGMVVDELMHSFAGRNVLVLVPGKSVIRDEEKIKSFIEENDPVVVGINVVPKDYSCDYLMCSNGKRFAKISVPDNCQLILTSNLVVNSEIAEKYSDAYVLNYSSYLVDNDKISDNPTLMFIQLCISMGIRKIFVAGFDGYSINPKENYFDKSLSMGTSIASKLEKNDFIKGAVQELEHCIDIEFITKSLYESE